MEILLNKKILQITFIVAFVLVSANVFSQKDTTKQSYLPHDATYDSKEVNSKVTTVNTAKTREKPGTFFGDILLYLSPIKEDSITLYYPAPVEADTIIESNHEVEMKNYAEYDDLKTEEEWNDIYKISDKNFSRDEDYYKDIVKLNRQVFGYHPYWLGMAYKNYDFGLLTRISYFSLPVNPKNGGFLSERLWKETKIIEEAQNYGCKVDLCISNFGTNNNTEFLKDVNVQENLINNIIELLTLDRGKDKNGKKIKAGGVNVNFEGVPKKHKDDFTKFIANLRSRLDAKLSYNFKITVTLPAIDWRNAYDIVELQKSVDFFFLMAYDFYGKYSKQAGPNSLLYSGGTWESMNIDNTVENYIKLGIDKKKLILGLPYYGNEWETKSDVAPSDNTKFIAARSYSYIADNYTSNSTKFKVSIDTIAQSVCYTYKVDGKWRQCWADNEITLGAKYDYILNKELAGLGIWALGYDNGYADLWDLIRLKFTNDRNDSIEIKQAIDRTLASNVITRSKEVVADTTPKYQTRFYNKINKFWNFFTLFFAIIMIFAIVGFVIAVSDFDVRFVLFNKEVRVYLFFILISIIAMFFIRMLDIFLRNEVYMVLAIFLGIVFALMVLKIGNMKRQKHGEEKP